MNERIHELAVQIGFPMDYENPAWAYEQDIYKFAELIVRECANNVDTFVAMNVPPALLSSLLRKQYIKDEPSKEL